VVKAVLLFCRCIILINKWLRALLPARSSMQEFKYALLNTRQKVIRFITADLTLYYCINITGLIAAM
jgi:hypothetical protein